MKRVGEIPSFDTDREGGMKPIGRRYLLLSPFFFPERISTGRYNTWLVRGLVQQGAHVDVVTSYPLYPLWKPTSTNDEFPNVIVHRGGLKIRYPVSTISRRVMLEVWYGIYALYWTIKLRFRVDTVIAIIPPGSFLPIIRRVLPKHVRLITVVHDLQGVMAMTTKTWVRKIVANMAGWIERKGLAACDKVVCLSESMRRVVVQNYHVDGARCEVHYPFVTLTGSTEARIKLQEYFPQGFYHVVYAGAFGEKHQPRELVEFFVRLSRKRSDIVCHIFSAGSNFTTYQNHIEKQGLNRIKFHELVLDEQLAELYERSTVQLIPQTSGTGPGAFPSKLPNLLAAGVPVFAMCDKGSELAEAIRESEAGIAIDNTDLDVWVEQMEQFLTRVGQTPHAVFRSRASDYVNKKFNLDKLIAAME